jgi:hypothetical protein
MSPDEALQLVLSKLESCGMAYMLTGSFASNMHGVPRTTYDADIVVEADQVSLDEFVHSLGKDFYVSHEAAREALSSRSMFNVIHLETGFKVDFEVKEGDDLKCLNRDGVGTGCALHHKISGGGNSPKRHQLQFASTLKEKLIFS